MENFPEEQRKNFSFFFSKKFQKKKKKEQKNTTNNNNNNNNTCFGFLSFPAHKESHKKEARFFCPSCVCRDDDADPKDDDDLYTTRQHRSRERELEKRAWEKRVTLLPFVFLFWNFSKTKLLVDIFDWSHKALCVCTLYKGREKTKKNSIKKKKI